MMKSSYAKEDVCLLLKDVTGLVAPLPAKEREILIQNGAHCRRAEKRSGKERQTPTAHPP